MFHWQNLNEKNKCKSCGSSRKEHERFNSSCDHYEAELGWGLRHGRAWWSPLSCEWMFLRSSCIAAEIGFDDGGIKFHVALTPLLFLCFSFGPRWLQKVWPKKQLSSNYPDTLVLIAGSLGIRIFSSRVRVSIWEDWRESNRDDPWWKKGYSFPINPFEYVYHSDYVWTDMPEWKWVPTVHPWEIKPRFESAEQALMTPICGLYKHDESDHRKLYWFSYRYTLKNGEVQRRTATVHLQRWIHRMKIFWWTSWFDRAYTSIQVSFDGEVGERTGSWKGGVMGCSCAIEPGETVADCLRRMERTEVFS